MRGQLLLLLSVGLAALVLIARLRQHSEVVLRQPFHLMPPSPATAYLQLPPSPPPPLPPLSAAVEPSGAGKCTYAPANLIAFRFVALPGSFLSVGRDIMSPEPCWASAAFLSAAAGEELSPNVMFEVVPLGPTTTTDVINRGGDVSLRSLSSGRLLRAVSHVDVGPTWVVIADGSSPTEAGTRWRLEVTPQCKMHLYAHHPRGFLNLPVTKSLDVRTHRPGGGGGATRSVYSELVAVVISTQAAAHARALVNTSAARQASALLPSRAGVGGRRGRELVSAGRLAIVTPVTSRGTRMRSVSESPFFNVLLPSLLRTWHGPSAGGGSWHYAVYVGADRGDQIFDAPHATETFRASFRRHIPSTEVTLRFELLAGLVGSPSQVVAELMALAYCDGAEWLFQLNDDAQLLSRGWEAAMASTLASSPLYPFLGATGPSDETNPRIFTHAFVHRTHLDIHGRFFPRAFKNWYSDDWISATYGPAATFKLANVRMKHQVGAQKLSGQERYQIDHNASVFLADEVSRGLLRVHRWLSRHDIPGLPTPTLCGYSPFVELEDAERRGTGGSSTNHTVVKCV